MPNTLTFEWVLGPVGLAPARTLHVDTEGRIERDEPAGSRRRDGYLALPGMANAHSHAFQRALRGIGERGGLGSFWQWRHAMYQLADTLTPEELHVVACVAFAEMLESGYTTVAEFHYLHHLPDGARSPAMAQALVQAARDVGIGLSLLPVYYRLGGFGRAAEPGQRRFVHRDVKDFAATIESCPAVCTGLAAHSLRAVPVDELGGLVALADGVLGADSPLHIHVSEQPAEVRECVRHYGRPPILLLDQAVGLAPRWHLVHATHAGRIERQRIASSGATVVLCPLTEGQLGDGWFPAGELLAQGGQIAIGSDSNVRIDAWEEIRTLEFAQRAACGRRNVLTGPDGTGITLWRECARAGARSTASAGGEIAAGRAADLVVFGESGLLDGIPVASALDALLLGGGRDVPCDVYVGGQLRVQAGRALAHVDYDRFRSLLARTWNAPE